MVKNIELLTEANEYDNENGCPHQIILTTGIDTYPDEFNEFVFYKLEGEKYLLQENAKQEE